MAKQRFNLVQKIKDYDTAALIKRNMVAEGVIEQEGEIQIRRRSDGFAVVLRKEVGK